VTAIANRLGLVTRTADTLCRFGATNSCIWPRVSNHRRRPRSSRATDQGHRRALQHRRLSDRATSEHRNRHLDSTCTSFSETIQNVDAALYEAKRNLRGHHVVFTPTMHQRAVSRFSLVQELRQAFNAGDLVMHYQPIADLTTSQVVGFEALMRWNHPDRGWVPPNDFIPLAEQSDLILELGSFALRQSILEASKWASEDPSSRRPYVTVNLSAHQFLDPGLVPTIKELLAESALLPTTSSWRSPRAWH